MTWVADVISVALVAAGVVFMLAGSVGLLRLPDFYTRTHAASKVDTLGIIVLLAGLVVFEGFRLEAVKLTIAMVFVGMSNPVAAHALARAALRSGVRPWFRPRPDRKGEPDALGR